jgi:hypothetical protein
MPGRRRFIDYLAALKVALAASAEDGRLAYHRPVRSNHPDLNSADPDAASRTRLIGVELAARRAWARFDEMDREHRSTRVVGTRDPDFRLPRWKRRRIRTEMPVPPTRTDARSSTMSFRADHAPVEDQPEYPRAAGAAPTSCTVAILRRHVTDLCVRHGIVPIVGMPCNPRALPGGFDGPTGSISLSTRKVWTP